MHLADLRAVRSGSFRTPFFGLALAGACALACGGEGSAGVSDEEASSLGDSGSGDGTTGSDTSSTEGEAGTADASSTADGSSSGADDTTTSSSETTSGPTTTTSTTSATTTDPDATTDPTDSNSGEGETDTTTTTTGGACPEGNCTNKIDLLFVIDNSGSMGEEQLNLAKNFPLLVQRLQGLQDEMGQPINTDVNIMVTTTDNGVNVAGCGNPWNPVGAPVESACVDRLEHFTGQGTDPEVIPEACTDVCSEAVLPTGRFIHFDENGSNVPDVPPKDVNGDGIDDDPVAQALACIGPVGIDGCGLEGPLESMVRALDPGASWNQGSEPFLRADAVLAVAIITDEADCSIRDPGFFTTPNSFWETHPNGNPTPSSAICWNGAVDCTDDNNDGIFETCNSVDNGVLHDVNAYINYLGGIQAAGKAVVMLGIVGVPVVTAHNPEPPHEPIAGGVHALEYRDWIDGEYPGGDILPQDWPDKNAEYQHFAFGIGPGCTEVSANHAGQGIPVVRIKEVCESLNGPDSVRCCMESICDDDFSAAIECLTNVVEDVVFPPID